MKQENRCCPKCREMEHPHAIRPACGDVNCPCHTPSTPEKDSAEKAKERGYYLDGRGIGWEREYDVPSTPEKERIDRAYKDIQDNARLSSKMIYQAPENLKVIERHENEWAKEADKLPPNWKHNLPDTPENTDIEEQIRGWREEFTTPNHFGERQLDQFCTSNYTKDTPIINEASPIVLKHEEWLRQALLKAEQRGREAERREVREKVEKLRVKYWKDLSIDNIKPLEAFVSSLLKAKE